MFVEFFVLGSNPRSNPQPNMNSLFPPFENQIDMTENRNSNIPIETFVPQRPVGTAAERARRNLNAKLSNPLAGFSHVELRKQGRNFATTHDMGDETDIRAFELGAMLAQSHKRYASVESLTPPEKDLLRREFVNRWDQPWRLYAAIALCSLSAAVQGMGR